MIKKILITDPISELGLEQLKDAGLEVLYKPESSEISFETVIILPNADHQAECDGAAKRRRAAATTPG